MTFGFSTCKNEETPKKTEPAYYLKSDAKIPAFDASNAFAHTERQVAFGPRNPNSRAHQAALEFFRSELSKYADTVVMQNFKYTGYDNEILNLTNVIARFNPKAAKRIFLCAHWDSRPRAEMDKDQAKRSLPIPGANDGASGVGVLLELARVLNQNKVNYGVDLVLFDGEDYGRPGDLYNYFLGSKYFATQRPANFSPAFGILLDLVGDKEAVFEKEGLSMQWAPDVVNLVWSAAEKVKAGTFSDVQGNAIEDDHKPLNESGLSTIDIIDIDLVGASTPVARRNYWHTQKDDMSNISRETLQQIGNVLTYLIYSLEFGQPAA
ncbi:MAG: M28 family peptidase [Syntrophothermus sp.]